MAVPVRVPSLPMSRARSDGTAALERAGAETVKRAVQLDAASRFQESLVCYQEGIDLLLQVVKGTGLGTAVRARGGPGDPGAPRGRRGSWRSPPGRAAPGRAGEGRPLCLTGP